MFKRKGFTLVEILLVIVIIGILGAIVIPRIMYSKTKAQKAACDANVAALNAQIELYHMQEGSWPTALADLVAESDKNDDESYIDKVPICPFVITDPIPYDYNVNDKHRVTKHTDTDHGI